MSLKELRLDSNFIWWLDSRAFYPTRKLSFLSLSHNDLRDLQPSVFVRLRYLKDLDLSNNRLPALFRKNLVGLRSLEHLDLSKNPLVLIVNGALKSLKSMVELHLAHTNLRTLHPEMFIGAKNVEWLDIRDSKIEELRPSVFKYLNNLKHLQVSGNLITSIDQCIVKNLSKLIDMDLRQNPLHCGCSLSWSTQKNMPHLLGECKTPRRRARSSVDYRGNYLGCRARRNIECDGENNRWMKKIPFNPKSHDDMVEEIVQAPYRHIATVPGKNIRNKLALAFNYWLQISEEKLTIISETAQMLHNASLIIDDIEDNSKLRRGVPVAHSIFGIPPAINSANYMYFASLEKAIELNHPEVPVIFTKQILELHRGQAMDIYWRDSYTCPTEDEYRTMVIVDLETGGLFGLAIGLMQLFSSNKSDLKPLLDNLGLFFQIRDDYANLSLNEYSKNKGFAEDLTEGKFSFPIIHSLNIDKNKSKIMNILRQRTEDIDVKKYCVQLIEDSGSFDYTIKVLKELEKQIIENIEKLGGNPLLLGLVNELSKMLN
ncbi:DgyrCDS8872 [Dimorphilus gyrociliatus]|uniref:DgyrCDS8872 n=1 Tax=Dimorphilus gyrociliatus TaxID=2664684 RepID=A0A7I8VWX9_9ANNE|nr:DgyrCDS8872 [Dimorphilus gyrociliatus]